MDAQKTDEVPEQSSREQCRTQMGASSAMVKIGEDLLFGRVQQKCKACSQGKDHVERALCRSDGIEDGAIRREVEAAM